MEILPANTRLVENGLLTQSRLILLDSPLIFMTAFTAFAFLSFTNQQEQGPTKAFQPAWWFWLAMTGIGLGLTVSIKWVGLFTIAWVGSLTIVQLWVLIGDARNVTPVSRFRAPTSCDTNLSYSASGSSILPHECSVSLLSLSRSISACSPSTSSALLILEKVMGS